jgi:hypothetical protein
MSISFNFSDYRNTPCRSCGAAYRAHVERDEDGQALCPGRAGTFYELNLGNGNAMDLLRWLDLPAEPWGEHPASDLAARCQRRLWDVERNHDAEIAASDEGGPGTGHCRVIGLGRRPDYLREKTADLLWLAELAKASPDQLVTWG